MATCRRRLTATCWRRITARLRAASRYRRAMGLRGRSCRRLEGSRCGSGRLDWPLAVSPRRGRSRALHLRLSSGRFESIDAVKPDGRARCNAPTGSTFEDLHAGAPVDGRQPAERLHLKAATLAARLIDATHHDGNLAVGRAVHITGKLRKEPDTAISRCENGLIRARDFCKSGGIMAAALRSRLSISCRPPSRRMDAPVSPQTVPEIVFHTRVRNDALGGPVRMEGRLDRRALRRQERRAVRCAGRVYPCLFGYAPAGLRASP